MPNVRAELDRLRNARRQIPAPTVAEPTAGRIEGVGARPTWRVGQKVRDPVTGEEAEVVGYDRAVLPGAVAPGPGG